MIQQISVGMSSALLVQKFELSGPVSHREREIIEHLVGAEESYSRRTAVRRENDAVTGAFLLIDGWVSSSIVRTDGGVFISHIYLPGDVIGATDLGHVRASVTLMALSPTVLAPIPKARLGRLFERSPRLGALMYVHAMRDAVAFTNRTAALARSSAESRTAALFVDLYDRACAIDPHQADLMDFPLTQQDIANALGLTSVHVSRMIRNFINRGWLRRRARAFIVRDLAALRKSAGTSRREIDWKPDWLPK